MFKTFIQLVLLLILVLIIFVISKKYFYVDVNINEPKNINTLNFKKKNLLNKKNTGNEIIDLTYEKFDINGNKYLVKSKEGILDSVSSNIIYMNIVEASLTYPNNEKLIIYSKEAIFDKNNFKTTFSKNVKLLYKEQILESDKLDFLINKNIAIFKDNVRYNNQNLEAFSDIIIINLLTKEIDIKSKNQNKVRIKKN